MKHLETIIKKDIKKIKKGQIVRLAFPSKEKFYIDNGKVAYLSKICNLPGLTKACSYPVHPDVMDRSVIGRKIIKNDEDDLGAPSWFYYFNM